MLLAGDVGGTKTLLGLFERAYPRPIPIAIRSYLTTSFASFLDMVRTFTRETPRGREVETVTLGVAGPVAGNRARLTNVSMDIIGDEIASELGTPRVHVLNDLVALALAVPILTSEELTTLQEGRPLADGNAAVIAAGTGLGEAFLHRVEGRWIPLPTEAGHADFAARSDREIELARMLFERYGRAEVEHVLSGPGLMNLHSFTHRGGECPVLEELEEGWSPAHVTQSAMSGRCQSCVDALRMFVSAYGAEAGNLALRGVTTSGMFIGGGIARKILPFIQNGLFMEAFLAKGPLRELLQMIPVRVILNEQAGLVGAAADAQAVVRNM